MITATYIFWGNNRITVKPKLKAKTSVPNRSTMPYKLSTSCLKQTYPTKSRKTGHCWNNVSHGHNKKQIKRSPNNLHRNQTQTTAQQAFVANKTRNIPNQFSPSFPSWNKRIEHEWINNGVTIWIHMHIHVPRQPSQDTVQEIISFFADSPLQSQTNVLHTIWNKRI